MRKRWIIIGGLSAALTLCGADLTGIWVGQISGRNGEPQDIAFQFKQSGTALSGKLYGDYQSTPITEGKVAGDLVTFVLKAEEQNGNQINETRLRFTGKLRGDELELFRDREASTNAGNGGAVQLKTAAKQMCVLKRLP